MPGHGQDEAFEPNPLEPSTALIPESVRGATASTVHPQKDVAAEDSAVTKAEKFERHAVVDGYEESSTKRVKLDLGDDTGSNGQSITRSERQKGVAPIKAESVLASTKYTNCELISR